MADEIPAPPVENPEVQTPPPPAPVETPDPPPATKIVVEGTKTEREIELERQLEANKKLIRDREMSIAEREKEIQRLKEILASPKTPKPKRKKNWSDPVFGGEDE